MVALVLWLSGWAGNPAEAARYGRVTSSAPSTSSAPPEQSQPKPDETISVRISNGKVTGVPGQVEVNRGSRVRIEVTSDRSDEVHVHGYDKTVELMSDLGHALRAFVLTAALTCLFALLNPIPAAAHIVGTGGSPTNYRTTVTGIRPAAPTVGVTVGLGGQWVRVTNQGAVEIVILGYQGEPFLRLSQNQVQVNDLSSTAAETGLARGAPVPAAPAPQVPTTPNWVGVSTGDNATWNDTRVSRQESGSWELPLVVDGQRVTVLGAQEEISPPSPWPWVAILVLLTLAVVVLGRRPDWHRPMAAVIVVGMLAFVAHVLGTGFSPQENGKTFGWIGVSGIGAFSLVIGTVTAVSVVRRSAAATDRLVIFGAMVLLLAATDISVLWYSQLPFGGPVLLDRILTVLTYASALGLLIAGLRLVRAARSNQLSQGG